MSSRLSILYLEDDVADAELVRDTLEAEGIACDVTRVETESGFLAALQQGGFDLVLADFTLPSFDGLSALKIAGQQRPDLPFIFVSGTLGEAVAIEALKIGATDYVLKTQMSRLVPSVQRALREAGERTVRKKSDEALRRGERELRNVIETIPAMVWGALPDGSNVSMNQRWSDYTGGSATGLGWQAAVHPDDLESHLNAFYESSAKGMPFQDEVRLRRADGVYRWFLVQGAPMRDGQGNVLKWYGIVTDIEDRKRAEAEGKRLRQLESDLAHINRVSMMGELAASVAHEVSQPLSGVVSNASACLRWLADEAPNLEETREAVQRIVRDGKRAGEVMTRIRALTRKAGMPREKQDLNDTIREVLALVGDEAKSRRVIIRTRFAEELSPVYGDRVQLQQVVLNLIINGIEAMSSVGEGARELLITTRNVDADLVQASVEDSGIGIDPQKLDKIFDSFYTTKPSGMGMGLSISRSILQAHGGRLWATANAGPGTTFQFTLPIGVLRTGTPAEA
jgi:PAS domain S-box-containing protein